MLSPIVLTPRLFYKYYLCIILCVIYIQVKAQNDLADKQASPQTVNLYQNIKKLPTDKIMFGHHDDLNSGIGWRNQRNRSDIKELAGDYPAVYGFDLGFLEMGRDTNLSRLPFGLLKDYVREIYQRGGVVTFSWHCNNPVNPSINVKSRRVANTIGRLFSDPTLLATYNTWLDRLADYFKALKDDNGVSIPVLFRPFHENTGNSFWWGKNTCTPDEYIKLWRYTVDYLNKTKNVHNVIYVYCTNRFNSKSEFLERYPGDDYVDILGFDIYQHDNNTNPVSYSFVKQAVSRKFINQASAMVANIREIGLSKHKPYALTEVGFKLIPDQDWWTQTLLPVLRNSGLCYVLIWGNYNVNGYWGTYKGQTSSEDFKKFYNNESVLFQNSASKLKLYQKH